MHSEDLRIDLQFIVTALRCVHTRREWIALFVQSWTLEHFEFTRFIRARNSHHSRVKFTTQQTRIRVMGGASARQLQSRCKMYSCFCKSMKMHIQLRVPTYNHNYFVLHCCFGFSASAHNDVTARASSWLVSAARIFAKVQIFQLARMARQTLNSRHAIHAASFARIAPQDCLSRLCIDLTCKSFAGFALFASGVNAPLVFCARLCSQRLNS